MGAWSVSINGNDTAEDLRPEYQAVFSCFSPEEAVTRLDAYVQKEGYTEDDMIDYVYSLSWYMWKHGRLTENVRQRAYALMDSGAGLELYEEAGVRRQREKILEKFRGMLDAPQPKARPIRLKLYQKPVFQVGDVVAVQLHTQGKPFYSGYGELPESVFQTADGHWMLLRKVRDQLSWRSAVVPEVRDIWPNFEVFDFCGPEMPTMKDFRQARVIDVVTGDGTMPVYRRRQARVLGNDIAGMTVLEEHICIGNALFMGAGVQNDQEELRYLWLRGTCLQNLI